MPPHLRTAYLDQRKQLEALSKEAQSLRSEVGNLRASKPAEDPDREKLTETLQAREKRIKDLEAEIHATAFERSDEYKNDYLQPYVDAFLEGRRLTAGLDAQNDNGSSRPGTEKDFDEIMALANEKDAVARAKELFGDAATSVLIQRQEVLKQNRRRANALQKARDDADKNSQEKTALTNQQQADLKKQQQALKQKLTTQNAAHIESRPDLMKPADGDDIAAKLLAQGEAVADLAFGLKPGTELENLPDRIKEMLVDGKLPLENLVELHSELWAKGRAYGHVVYLLKKAQARASELETELKDYRGSEPGVGGGRRGAEARPGQISVEDEIDQMAAANAGR